MYSFGSLTAVLGAAVTIAALASAQQYHSVINVNPFAQYQPITGSGGALTQASAVLLAEMNGTTRRSLLMALFGAPQLMNRSGKHGNGGGSNGGPGVSAGYSFIRLPMGSCDFSTKNYTYDDLPAGVADDYDMQYFSINNDFDLGIIRALQEMADVYTSTRTTNTAGGDWSWPRGLKIIAAPWSPPAWMKTGNTLFGSSLQSSNDVIAAYAKYFRKFVEEYHIQAGIDVYAVSPQNEPLFSTGNYPSCYLSPQQEIQLALAIAEEFENSTLIREKIKTKILIYDHNWNDPQYPITVFANASIAASKWIVGAAFHCYAGNVSAQGQFHAANPSKEVYMTECTGGSWAPDFGSDLVWDLMNLVAGAPNYWAQGVLKWNLVLDQNGGPHLPSACTNCRGEVMYSTVDGSVTYKEDFYALAHLSVAVSGSSGRQLFRVDNDHAFSGSPLVVLTMAENTTLAFGKLARSGQSAAQTILVSAGAALVTNQDASNAQTFQLNFQSSVGNRTCITDPVLSLAPSAVMTLIWDAVVEAADGSGSSSSGQPPSSTVTAVLTEGANSTGARLDIVGGATVRIICPAP